jgi:hypothetical protein
MTKIPLVKIKKLKIKILKRGLPEEGVAETTPKWAWLQWFGHILGG